MKNVFLVRCLKLYAGKGRSPLQKHFSNDRQNCKKATKIKFDPEFIMISSDCFCEQIMKEKMLKDTQDNNTISFNIINYVTSRYLTLLISYTYFHLNILFSFKTVTFI